MKRRFVGRSGAMTRSQEGEQGFWPSYADMMSAVALILFFLMLLSYIQNLITGNNLQSTRELLEDTRVQLSDTQTELGDTQAVLSLTLQQAQEAQADLDKITIDLDEARLTLTQQQQERTKDLAAQNRLLADQKALIGKQEEYMKAASQELLAMRSQMQTIAVLRLSILEQIRDSMVKVMGDASKVSIGSNGNIILSESILFDLGSSEIKPRPARPGSADPGVLPVPGGRGERQIRRQDRDLRPHRQHRFGRIQPQAIDRACKRGAGLPDGQ